jgi:hypothetical protein
MRREISVTIYERVMYGTTWRRQRVVIPSLKANGTFYLKDDRQGIFQLSWYENREKHWQKAKGRVSDRELPFLSDAIAQAREKSWFLSNHHRDVSDPAENDSTRKKLSIEATRYIDAKSGCKKTVSAHEYAVTEFVTWVKKPKKGRGVVFVDEVTKSILRRFFEFLVDGEEDDDGLANHVFTAAMKVIRVNSFVRATLGLEPGKGPVTKKDFKRELRCNRVPEIYPRQELELLTITRQRLSRGERAESVSRQPRNWLSLVFTFWLWGEMRSAGRRQSRKFGPLEAKRILFLPSF